jgi:hypothetical protein
VLGLWVLPHLAYIKFFILLPYAFNTVHISKLQNDQVITGIYYEIFIRAKMATRVHLFGCTAIKHSSFDEIGTNNGGLMLVFLLHI